MDDPRFPPNVRSAHGQKKLKQDMGRERNGGGDNGENDPEKPRLDPRVARRRQDPIGRKLRKFYTDVVEESIPDEFLAILEEAEARQGDPGGPVAGAESPDVAPGAPPTQPER